MAGNDPKGHLKGGIVFITTKLNKESTRMKKVNNEAKEKKMKTLLSVLMGAIIVVAVVGCKTITHDDMTPKQHQSSAAGLSQ